MARTNKTAGVTEYIQVRAPAALSGYLLTPKTLHHEVRIDRVCNAMWNYKERGRSWEEIRNGAADIMTAERYYRYARAVIEELDN